MALNTQPLALKISLLDLGCLPPLPMPLLVSSARLVGPEHVTSPEVSTRVRRPPPLALSRSLLVLKVPPFFSLIGPENPASGPENAPPPPWLVLKCPCWSEQVPLRARKIPERQAQFLFGVYLRYTDSAHG